MGNFIVHSIFLSILLVGNVFAVTHIQANDLSDYQRPLTIPFTEETPYSPQMTTLGKMLFYDPRLSGAKNMNCVSCHNPSFGFETPVPLAIGAANRPINRHAQTVLNMAWVSPFLFDGGAKTLEEVSAGPMIDKAQMNITFEALENDLAEVDYYKQWFERIFPGRGIRAETILEALAAYQRTIVSGWAPFDRWVEGDAQAVSEEAKKGFKLFIGKAGCAECHSGWNFTDNQFHDIGLPNEQDIGRAALDPTNPKARFAFKTPGLRNLTYRAPFMHDGSIDNLADVISHYDQGGVVRNSKSDKIKALHLSQVERDQLLIFLQSLTAEKINPTFPILPN